MRTLLVSFVLIGVLGCGSSDEKVDDSIPVILVSAPLRPQMRALVDSMWNNYAIPVDSVKQISGGIRVSLHPGFGMPEAVSHKAPCLSTIPIPGPALERFGQYVWEFVGRNNGFKVIEIGYGGGPAGVVHKFGQGTQTCSYGIGTVYYRPTAGA